MNTKKIKALFECELEDISDVLIISDDSDQETSISTNFDWYAPSNAKRYSLEEFIEMTANANLSKNHIHSEEACHSGRFKKL